MMDDKQNNGKTSEPTDIDIDIAIDAKKKFTPTLVVPTSGDFDSIAEMKYLAFQEKTRCCVKKNVVAETRKSLTDTASKHPRKLEHCRIVKSDDGSGRVLGACQVQLPGDIGDLSFPPSFRHKTLPREAYVEFIACHPDSTGMGIGSAMLEWAASFAKENGCRFISLEVMAANPAVRLYERKGYKVKSDPHADECDWLFAPCFVYCCFGCTYCSTKYMEKNLEDHESLQMER
jgi:ribosomal protein S18 acetylase RimI-like enzyme